MYKYPKFTKNKVKQAFLKAGGWHIEKEYKDGIVFMPDGYKSIEGFCFYFIADEEESKEYDMPIGEAYLIDIHPWVAVDTNTAEDYKSLDQIIEFANDCVKNHGKPYKIKGAI